MMVSQQDEVSEVMDELAETKRMLREEQSKTFCKLETMAQQKEEILSLHAEVVAFFEKVQQEDVNLQALYKEAVVAGDEITSNIRRYRNNHWERLANEKMPPLLSTTYTDVMNSYRKIKTILIHVAETRSGEK